jgi:hypothetical protein
MAKKRCVQVGKRLDNGAILIALFGPSDYDVNKPAWRYAIGYDDSGWHPRYMVCDVDVEGNIRYTNNYYDFFAAVECLKERAENCVQLEKVA